MRGQGEKQSHLLVKQCLVRFVRMPLEGLYRTQFAIDFVARQTSQAPITLAECFLLAIRVYHQFEVCGEIFRT